MAKSIEEILGKPINSVKELRNELNSLRDSLIGLDQESQEYADTEKKIAAAQAELNTVTRAGKDIYVGATDSIKGMEAEYRKLYATYSQLTEAERNSAFGKETAAQLKTMSDKLNETKQGVGNFKDNIGRYADAITSAFKGAGVSIGGLKGPLGVATTGMKGFNTVVKANPIGLITTAIMALIGVFQKMREAIGANEEKQMKLNEIMARFQPIIDSVKNGLDALADTFLKIVDWATKAATAVRRFFASDKEAFDAEQKAYQDLAKAQNEYTKKKRENKELNAKDNATVKALEEEASATENASEKQRLLTEAKDKQAEIDQRMIEEAEEHLRILEAEAALTANDAEANERLAEAKAAVANATAQADANAKRFNRQIQTVTRSMRSAAGSAKNLKEEAKKLFEQTQEDNKTELQKLDEKYKKEYELLKKYGFDTTNLTKNYSKERLVIVEKEKKTEREAARTTYQAQTEFYKRAQEARQKLLKEGSAKYLANALDESMKDFEKLSPAFKLFEESYARLEKNIALLNKLKTSTKAGGDSVVNEAIRTAAKTFGKEAELIFQNFDFEDINIKFPAEWTEKTVKEFAEFMKNVKEGLQGDMAQIYKEFSEAFLKQPLEAFNKTAKETITELQKYYLSDSISADNIDTTKAGLRAEALEMEREALEKLLADEKITGEQRIQVEEEYYTVLEKLVERKIALEELSAERTVGVWDAAFDSINNLTNSINSIISTYSTLMQAEIQSGKLTESECKKKEKALKRLAAVQLAVSVANITASNAAAIMDVWRGYSAEMPVNAETAAAAGPAAAGVKAALDAKSLTAAILKTVGISANAVAQLAAARGSYISTVNNLQSDSAGGTASVASVSTIDSAPFTYSKILQTSEEAERLNRPIYVKISDISDGLKMLDTRDAEVEF